MDRLPLVSVLVPCYNHEKYVMRTIDSVMEQSYPNMELLVIDDGSQDNSVQVIKDCELKWGKTFLVEAQANMGLCKTLNKLEKLAKGKYICFIASDDWMLPEKLTVQVAYLEAHPHIGMVYSDALTYFEQQDSLQHVKYAKNYPSGWLFDRLLEGNFITACSTMIRRECFEKVGYFDESAIAEDWDMWLRIAREYEIHYIDERTVVYRIHGKNTVDLQFSRMMESMKSILQKYCADEKKLAKYLLAISFRELRWYAGKDRMLARKKFKDLAPYFYRPDYLAAVVKYILAGVRRPAE
jgi:alpha-1,3-rhamnosyltransferase